MLRYVNCIWKRVFRIRIRKFNYGSRSKHGNNFGSILIRIHNTDMLCDGSRAFLWAASIFHFDADPYLLTSNYIDVFSYRYIFTDTHVIAVSFSARLIPVTHEPKIQFHHCLHEVDKKHIPVHIYGSSIDVDPPNLCGSGSTTRLR